MSETSPYVLVIDDEEVVCDFVRLALERFGFRVATAATGEEGLACFASQPDAFSVVLLDVLLPDMGGEDVLRQLRECRADVPVLFSSGFQANRALDAGRLERERTDFISKPYLAGALAEKLRALIGD